MTLIMKPVAMVALTALVAAGGASCKGDAPEPLNVGAHAGLVAHSAEFEKKVYEVTEGVYVAVGYGLANSILIEGDGGLVIVDTMESLESAQAVRAEFKRISDKPILAVVYTHNHADHVFGARAFVEEGSRSVPIYAHETTNYYIDRVVNVIRPAISRRSMRMFGNYLPEGGLINCGIGPRLFAGHGGGTVALLRPTHTFADELDLQIGGVKLKLVHAPGETDDQLFVWLPEKRTLLAGDNFYRSFPNLYTIRGTPYRDVMKWVRSLDRMRELRPEHLVPSHTRPLSGVEHIHEQLTAYRDAIQYVHDQSIRGINAGLGPDELVQTVRLPPHLAASPWLQEYYGTVEWSVRSIFSGYLGWFGGDAAYLSPVGTQQRARLMAELAGGEGELRRRADEALAAGRFRWAAELADYLLRLEPGDRGLRLLKAEALKALGERAISSNGRNYYLTQALEFSDEIDIGAEQALLGVPMDVVYSFPLEGIFRAMAVRLDPEKAADVDQVVGFRFPDTDEGFTIRVRRGVAEIQARFPEDPDVSLTLSSRTWLDILLGQRSAVVALASDDVGIEGSALELIGFLRLFDRS